jgi:diamine N-acetyltransferase
MIGLRNLKIEDATSMLEWMHDPEIQKGFRKKMNDATIEDVLDFIEKAADPLTVANGGSLHLAITEKESDRYLGTVSLKNIDTVNCTAEYALIVIKSAQHMGVARDATQLILKKAFHEMGLHRVYLSVYSNNDAAIRLYERSGFKYEGEFRDHFIIDGEYVGWKWYGILKEEFDEIVSGANKM